MSYNIYLSGNRFITPAREYECVNFTDKIGTHNLELFDTRIAKDISKYDELWFVEDSPIVNRPMKNSIFVDEFDELMEELLERGFWEITFETD